jgi:hypothetical protein
MPKIPEFLQSSKFVTPFTFIQNPSPFTLEMKQHQRYYNGDYNYPYLDIIDPGEVMSRLPVNMVELGVDERTWLLLGEDKIPGGIEAFNFTKPGFKNLLQLGLWQNANMDYKTNRATADGFTGGTGYIKLSYNEKTLVHLSLYKPHWVVPIFSSPIVQDETTIQAYHICFETAYGGIYYEYVDSEIEVAYYGTPAYYNMQELGHVSTLYYSPSNDGTGQLVKSPIPKVAFNSSTRVIQFEEIKNSRKTHNYGVIPLVYWQPSEKYEAIGRPLFSGKSKMAKVDAINQFFTYALHSTKYHLNPILFMKGVDVNSTYPEDEDSPFPNTVSGKTEDMHTSTSDKADMKYVTYDGIAEQHFVLLDRIVEWLCKEIGVTFIPTLVKVNFDRLSGEAYDRIFQSAIHRTKSARTNIENSYRRLFNTVQAMLNKHGYPTIGELTNIVWGSVNPLSEMDLRKLLAVDQANRWSTPEENMIKLGKTDEQIKQITEYWKLQEIESDMKDNHADTKAAMVDNQAVVGEAKPQRNQNKVRQAKA